ILRIAARRMLAAAFAGTLFHALISFSVVCHINPLLCSLIELSGRDGAASASCPSTVMPSQSVAECEVEAAGLQGRQHSNGTLAAKKQNSERQQPDRRGQTAGERSTRVEWFCRMC